MLTAEIIEEFVRLVGEEDASLWAQGDTLNTHKLTKDEVKQLARIIQQNPTHLFKRQFVATETPQEKRHPAYSWNLYAVFTKISDPEQRWQAMFGRDNWTLVEAKDFVKSFNTPAHSEQKQLKIQRAELRVGKYQVKAKLDPLGNLTLLVNVGGNRVCEVTPQSVNTKIVFPAG